MGRIILGIWAICRTKHLICNLRILRSVAALIVIFCAGCWGQFHKEEPFRFSIKVSKKDHPGYRFHANVIGRDDTRSRRPPSRVQEVDGYEVLEYEIDVVTGSKIIGIDVFDEDDVWLHYEVIKTGGSNEPGIWLTPAVLNSEEFGGFYNISELLESLKDNGDAESNQGDTVTKKRKPVLKIKIDG